MNYIEMNMDMNVQAVQLQPQMHQQVMEPVNVQNQPVPIQNQPQIAVQNPPQINIQNPTVQIKPEPKSKVKNDPDAQDKKPKIDKKKKEAIDGQAKEVIYRVIKFFESEKQNRGYAFPVENVVKRACAATGLSESTIKRIKRDGIRAEQTQTRIPGPKKKRVRKSKVQLDYFQLCALRGIVNGFSMRKEVPTLGKILVAARNELNYKGGKESLRLILLNKLGIKFKKSEKKNNVKKEEPPQVEQQPQMHQMNHVPNTVTHIQMQPMKPENQCLYMMQQVQPVPVSY